MKSNNKFESVPNFNEKQIENQLQKQISFLNKIYPWLSDDNYHDGVIEIRPIKREKEEKYIRSYNTWRLQEKDIESLRKFLNLVNGKGYCLYYSTFCFDYSLENNDKKQKGKINNENALYTSILPIDFDDITEEEFKLEKEKLLNLGIETVDVFTGHGFQSIILLNQKVYDKSILNKFTKLLISKGFKADPAIVDCARIMRLPYSFNCKSLDVKSKHYEEGVIPCQLVADTEKRYKLVEIFEKLTNMKDIIESEDNSTFILLDNIAKIKVEPITYVEKEKKIQEMKEVHDIKIENLQSLYKDYLDIEILPDPIKKMLQGTQEGLRNKVLLFIIPFFRVSLGLNIQTIKSILKIWGELSTPILTSDFIKCEVNRIYKYDFKGAYGKYTEELRKTYGYLEFNKFTRQNKILIPNAIFNDFHLISDGAVQIYLSIKLKEQIDSVKEFTKQDIQEVANIVERTLERNIKDLVAMGYVCKRRTNRRLKEKYIYYINPYFNKTAGFTMIENAVVKLMINELTDGEIKLYSYLCMMISSNRNDCSASQKYLAKNIGKKGHSSISKMTDELVKKKYITKKTIDKDGVKHCIYNLNY